MLAIGPAEIRLSIADGGLGAPPDIIDRLGEPFVRQAVGQFVAHYHAERNHQGLGNQILVPGEEVGRPEGPVMCRQRLGGLLRYYYRRAA